VQCRELLQRAYNLELLPLQVLHVLRALLHLVISLANALAGVFNEEDSLITEGFTDLDNVGALLKVAPIIASNLQRWDARHLRVSLLSCNSVLHSFGGTVKALEERFVDPEEHMEGIRRVLNDLCGDYPGAVVVRQSFESFKRLVRMDCEEIGLSTSDDGTVISGAAVGSGYGRPGKGTHIVSYFERIAHHDEEASTSGQGYKGKGTSFAYDRAAREPAKPQTQDSLVESEGLEPDNELGTLAKRAFSSLQVVGPWSEARYSHSASYTLFIS
jgi:hypothetical protein